MRRVQYRALYLMVLWLACLQASDVSAQALELEILNGVQMTYEPFSGQASIESLNLRVRSDGGEELESAVKTYGLRIRKTNLGPFQLAKVDGSTLPFSIRSSTSQPFRLIDDYYFHFVNVKADQQEPLSLTYDFIVAESIWAEAGAYTALIDVDLVNVDDIEDVLISKTVEFEVVVEPKLQTNLAGQLGSFEDGVDVAIVDFGRLETAESKKIFIQVRGNAKAVISLASENGGKMVHSVNPDWVVDYSVNVDGEASGLESPMELQRSVAKNFRGSAYPMTISVGDVGASFSGKYRDVITIDVSPQ